MEGGQLGPGYQLSSWVEREAVEHAEAVIAVSQAMARDVLAVYPGVDPARVRVVHNGIDTDEFFPDPGTAGLERQVVDPSVPYVLFVGRVTRQKGITYLLEAAGAFDPAAQVVFCAGAHDCRIGGRDDEGREECGCGNFIRSQFSREALEDSRRR